jgi:MioC protein
MSQSVTVLVGTMTGNAELVAQELEQCLSDAGYSPLTRAMDGLDCGALADGGVFIIVSSTYGNGDVPDNAQAFFASLQADRPDLQNVIYGVVALGDMTYRSTFCHGGLKFDQLLGELGARRAGEPLLHDANSGVLAEDAAVEWATDWIKQELALALAA